MPDNNEALREVHRLIAKSVEMATLAVQPFLANEGRKDLAVQDLVACLMHYCDHNEIEFEKVLDFAREDHHADMAILVRCELSMCNGGQAAERG